MLSAADVTGLLALPPSPLKADGEHLTDADTLDLDEATRLAGQMIDDGAAAIGLCGTTGECATLTASSDDARALAREAHFEIGVAPLPSYEDAGVAARPLSESVPAVWAERQSVGVASFFAFLATRAAAARHEREIMETELEAVWRGDKSAPQALETIESNLGPRLRGGD